MKKEIFYLIGAVAGALLVLLAVPLGNAYIGNYLSVYAAGDSKTDGDRRTPTVCH